MMATATPHRRTAGARHGTPLLVLLALFGLVFPLHAGETIHMAVSISTPPFFIKEVDSGIEWEIIREAFKEREIKVVPIFRRSKSRKVAYVNKEVNCASTADASSELPGVFSDPVIRFENAAITLEKNKVRIDSVADLKGRNIIAFNGAALALGEDFAKVVEGNRRYRERYKNELMPVLLYRDRVEVAISDLSIFHFFSHKMERLVDVSQPVTVHRIFPPKEYGIVCHEGRLIQEFNLGLRAIRESGRYQAIQRKYLKEFFEQGRPAERQKDGISSNK